MDYSQFSRSQNVEDMRPGPVGSWVNYLTGPIQNAAYQLWNHPFENRLNHYEQLYLKDNPPLTPDQYTPLGMQAGLGNLIPAGNMPQSTAPPIFGPEIMQILQNYGR